jgi:uncharacterized paraquat-inducible protein A
MACGTKHNDAACPRCGSKMKRVGWSTNASTWFVIMILLYTSLFLNQCQKRSQTIVRL